jgi:LysM repeat protein
VTGRSPARLLAPLALVVCAVALYAVVSSGSEDTGKADDSAVPAATASPSKKNAKIKDKGAKGSRKTYTVKAGDTPSAIAAKTGVSLEDLLAANPDADPNALSPGQKLKLP